MRWAAPSKAVLFLGAGGVHQAPAGRDRSQNRLAPSPLKLFRGFEEVDVVAHWDPSTISPSSLRKRGGAGGSLLVLINGVTWPSHLSDVRRGSLTGSGALAPA